MKRFYISSGITFVLYLIYNYTSNTEFKTNQYFDKITQDRGELKGGVSISDSAKFLMSSLSIDAPSEVYQIKCKNITSDSVTVYVQNKIRTTGEILKFSLKDSELNIKLRPDLKPTRPTPLTYKGNEAYYMSCYSNLMIITKETPESISLKTFSGLVLDAGQKQPGGKLTLKLEEGAEMEVNEIIADTLEIYSACNSSLFLNESKVKHVIHHFGGGKIKSTNTIIKSYALLRTQPSWCTAKAEIHVSEKITGKIVCNSNTYLSLAGAPEIDLTQQENTIISEADERFPIIDDIFFKSKIEKYGRIAD